MAIAPLTRVRIRSASEDLGRTLADLLRFGRFHPSRREGLVQDIRIVLWASRAQELHGQATELLRRPELRGAPAPGPPAAVPVDDVADALRELSESLAFLGRHLDGIRDPADARELVSLLRSVQGLSLALFQSLYRVLVEPEEGASAVLEGFVPTRDLGELETILGSRLIEQVPIQRRGQDDPYVPTLLVNPRAISLFERMTLDRGIPRYSEIDPTPIVALVFPLFFGIMFGDLGHGLSLLVVGFFVAHRTRFLYWGQLMMVFGIAASVVGFVRGVFFGVTFTTPLHALIAFPPAFSAELTFSYLPILLEASVLIGTVHLGSAYLFAIWNQMRSRRYAEALSSGVPTLALYIALVPLGFAVLGTGLRPWLAFTLTSPTPFFSQFLDLDVPVRTVSWVTAPVALAALVALILGPLAADPRARRSVASSLRALLQGLTQGLSRPLEFTLNTLSYIRLAALLIANTLLTSLVAGALTYGVGGAVLAAALNVPLMVMEGVIVYLQDMRLHWLEWLSKFYAGTGTAFAPLRLEGPSFRVAWT